MAVLPIKKYKTIKDENGNKIQIPKTKEEWNKETKNGSCTWYFYCRYKINNNTKQYKSGVFALKREADSEERLFKLNPIEYIKTHSKRAKIDIIEDVITNKVLDNYYNSFFEYDYSVNKESTAYSHKKNYYKHVSPILGQDNPFNIDITRIDYFHQEIEKKNISYSTKVNINSVLVKFLDFLVLKGIVKYNYAKLYGSFKKKNDEDIPIIKEIKYQTIEEFNFFMDNVDNIFWHTFFNFLFWHGLRKGEQQALRWKDIDFEKEVVSIHSSVSKSITGGVKISSTKNKKNRIIYLAKQSYDSLKKYYNIVSKLNGFNENWIIFGRGEEITDIIARNTIDRKLKEYYDKLILNNPNKKINILTHHEFGRHSHASYLLNLGLGRIDIYAIIAQRLGDTEEVIRNTYAHPYENVNNDKTKDLLNMKG